MRGVSLEKETATNLWCLGLRDAALDSLDKNMDACEVSVTSLMGTLDCMQAAVLERSEGEHWAAFEQYLCR